MTDEEFQAAKAEHDKQATRDAQIAAMQVEIDRLKTNPNNYDVTRICNGCGVVVKDGERCERHPKEPVNHFRNATDAEMAERRSPLVLVKQA